MAKKEANVVNKDKKSFFKSMKVELKKVIWPTPKQLVNSTVAVITIVIITGIIVFTLDVLFKAMNDYGISKIKNVITTDNVEDNTTTNTQTVEDQSEIQESDNTTENQSTTDENQTQNTTENVENKTE